MSHQSNFLPTFDDQLHVIEYFNVSIILGHISTRCHIQWWSAGLGQNHIDRPIIFCWRFDFFHLFQHFHPTLDLGGFRIFISKSLDKSFCIFNLLLLVSIGILMLFHSQSFIFFIRGIIAVIERHFFQIYFKNMIYRPI